MTIKIKIPLPRWHKIVQSELKKIKCLLGGMVDEYDFIIRNPNTEEWLSEEYNARSYAAMKVWDIVDEWEKNKEEQISRRSKESN